MEDLSQPCPSGGLMALLTTMDSRRLAGSDVDAMTTQVSGTIQVPNHIGPIQISHLVVTSAHEADNPVQSTNQDDSPALDPVEATHHVDPTDGFLTPKKNPMSSRSVSNLTGYTVLFLFLNIRSNAL